MLAVGRRESSKAFEGGGLKLNNGSSSWSPLVDWGLEPFDQGGDGLPGN